MALNPSCLCPEMSADTKEKSTPNKSNTAVATEITAAVHIAKTVWAADRDRLAFLPILRLFFRPNIRPASSRAYAAQRVINKPVAPARRRPGIKQSTVFKIAKTTESFKLSQWVIV